MREGADSSVQAEIRVLEGQLGRSVVVRAFTMDGSAVGKLVQSELSTDDTDIL